MEFIWVTEPVFGNEMDCNAVQDKNMFVMFVAAAMFGIETDCNELHKLNMLNMLVTEHVSKNENSSKSVWLILSVPEDNVKEVILEPMADIETI
jgi:hypothetical protein